jgi:hypothetical protein
MTEREPPGMRCEDWIERQIREAQERGAFDDLPGAGKPIPGLDRPFTVPAGSCVGWGAAWDRCLGRTVRGDFTAVPVRDPASRVCCGVGGRHTVVDL